MRKTSVVAAFLFVVNLCSIPSNAGSVDDMDVFSMILPVLAITCDDGDFSNCNTPIGCLRIDGFWENGACIAKSRNWELTAQLAGQWNLSTAFPSGHNTNYFQFQLSSIERIRQTEDYSIEGSGHQSSQFNTTEPVFIIGAYDSAMSDWFILEIWGGDIGMASLFEFNFTSNSKIGGCEYFVSYPDLRYVDGICNQFNGYRYPLSVTTSFAESQIENSSIQLDNRSLYFSDMEQGSIRVESVDRQKELMAVRKLVQGALLNKPTSK